MYNDPKRRTLVLLGLYEMAQGNPLQGVESKILAEKLGMDHGTEFSQIGYYLKQEGLIGYQTFNHINITHDGVKEAERIMSETHSQKERRVLETMADIGRMSNNLIVFADLAKRLGMTNSELSMCCNGLEEKGYIVFPGGDLLQMKIAGYQALESQEKPPTPTINVLNMRDNYGAAAMGSHIQQTVHVNQQFDSAVNSLLQLVGSSDLPDDDKEEVVQDLRKISKLALREPSPGVIDKVNSRLEWIKTTLNGANLLVAAAPHIEAIWNYFKVKYGL